MIRDDLSRKSEDDTSVEGEILGVVKSAMKTSKARRRRKSVVTPPEHYAATDSDDDDDDEDVPEWAGDIMADLAIIADGHMPDALKE